MIDKRMNAGVAEASCHLCIGGRVVRELESYVLRLCTPFSVLVMFAAVEWKKLNWFLFSGGLYIFVTMGVLRAVDATSRVVLVKDARMNE